MNPREIRITVNGMPYVHTVPPRLTLADFLRDELGLTGTHLGCEHGVCGACSVLLDGEAVRSCLVFAVQCEGATITTVEGLADGTTLNLLQRAFQTYHALQCGFCTPGFLISATAYLNELTEEPTEEEIRVAMSGNLCRCTGYVGIVEAIQQAAQERLRTHRAG